MSPPINPNDASLSGMIKVGQKFPQFSVKAIIKAGPPESAFTKVGLNDYPGKWLMIFSWPKNFTFVCPTEISEFGKRYKEFSSRNTQILGFSTDQEFSHLHWRNDPESGLSDLPFPMLADVKQEISTQCGILDEAEGVAQRATFIVDPKGIVRFVMVTDLNVGRNPDEVLRVLDALQNGGLCPCNWQKGEKTL